MGAAPDDQQIFEQKFRLMETGRKYQFEDSQNQLKANKEVVNLLRKENKELKKQLLAIKEEKDREKDTTPGNLQDCELALLDHKINLARRALDHVRHESQLRRKDIELCRARLRDIEKVRPDVLDLDPGLARQIRMLENRLDKSMIKFNEAQAIRKTYEQIVKRLREERIGFDNQLAAIERTLKAKDHDYQELLNMSHDANHANAISKAELGQFRAAYEEDRRQKDQELSERKAMVQKRIDQTQKLEKKEKALKAKEAEAAAPKQEEEKPKTAVAEPAPEEQEKLREYEEYFLQIKEATGVQDGDVGVVIEKFISQEDTHRNLAEMKEVAEKKIEGLNQEKANLRAQLDEIKYSGSAQLGSRRIVDEFEAHLADARHQCEKNRAKYERAARVLINVKAGIEHLADKLQDFKRGGIGDPGEDLRPTMSDESVVKVMEYCEKKLQLLSDEVAHTLGTSEQPEHQEEVVLPPTNRRIKLPTSDDDEDNGDDDDEDEEEDVLDRDTVKKLANLALDRERKKSKKRGKKAAKE
eukprot:TRINITY_DN14053_c0_g1_i1.p1 TRINITY_DN14053_c0_g1~~TRINITY_DN14053_c0_g1_i1.p1  ORF type:complete len:556 (+),score=264.10 TRINITY_DN14053_c0_g1_i1:87-1670(+)